MIMKWCFRDAKRFTTPFRKLRRWRREVYPALSRFQNIGIRDGENDTVANRRKHRTPWVSDRDYGGFEFHG